MSHKIYKVIFFGTPEFAVLPLRALQTLALVEVVAVVTQPDKPVGKKMALTPPPVKVEAEKSNVKILQPTSIKGKNFEILFRQLNPDVVVIVAYGKIIPAALLGIPKYGWLNIHASLLPRYRGASPIQAALLAGDAMTGVTLMKIDSGLDTGPILAQKKITIMPSDDAQSLHHTLSRLGAAMLTDALPRYLAGSLKPASQQVKSPTPITKIVSKTDGRIDWQKPAVAIVRAIRAYTPWPGTFCRWNQKRLKVLEAQEHNGTELLPPGQTKLSQQNLLVGCGNGSQLKLISIQLEGKKTLKASDFLKGYPGIAVAQLQ